MGIRKAKKRKYNPIVNINGEGALQSKRRKVGTGARAQKQSNKENLVAILDELERAALAAYLTPIGISPRICQRFLVLMSLVLYLYPNLIRLHLRDPS